MIDYRSIVRILCSLHSLS